MKIRKSTKVVQGPIEGMPFEVKPSSINKKLFCRKRLDRYQEEARIIILQAFKKVEMQPEKYGGDFTTLMPVSDGIIVQVSQLIDMTKKENGHLANWVEQALEWAQRITNGESWEAVCNNPDTAKNHRLVEWKQGELKMIGGSTNIGSCDSATCFGTDNHVPAEFLIHTVPLIVKEKESIPN